MRRLWWLAGPVLGLLVVLGITAACGQDEQADIDARVTPPTQVPTESRPRPTSRPPLVWETVEAPDADAAGRPDCPDDWLAYTDPEGRYSICYPADFEASAAQDVLHIDTPQQVSQDVDGYSVTLYWERVTSFGTSKQIDPSMCRGEFIMVQESITAIELTLSDVAVPACFAYGSTDDGIPPLGTVWGAIPMAEERSGRAGFLNFRLEFGGPSVPRTPEAGKAVLDTLLVNFQ